MKNNEIVYHMFSTLEFFNNTSLKRGLSTFCKILRETDNSEVALRITV